MARKYYVIIVGANPGVHFAEWVEVGPLVKKYSSSIYQGVEDEELAWTLFENAQLKGQVRDLSLPPGSDTSPRPSTASVRRSSNSSAPGTPHRKHPSVPKLTTSRSEAVARNGVSSTRSNFRGPNPGFAAGGATTGLNCATTISKSRSEPNPPTSASISLKRVYEQGYSASNGTEPSSCVGAPNTRVRTRAGSPSWLAPYPGDQTSESVSSDLCPMASPAISSRSFKSDRPRRVSTPDSRFDGEAVEPLDDSSSSELAKSPVPSFRRQEVRGGSGSGIDRNIERKNAPLRRPSKDAPHGEAALQRQDMESFVQLVVDEVLRRLRSPDRVADELSSECSSPRPSGAKRHGRNLENGSKTSDGLSPCSPPQRSGSSPTSKAKALLSPRVLNGSVLFNGCHDDLENSPLRPEGLCSQCKGTGFEMKVDSSVLDETGLHQPKFGPISIYDAAQDPRSPLTNSKNPLLSPLTLRRSPPAMVPSKCSAKTSF